MTESHPLTTGQDPAIRRSVLTGGLRLVTCDRPADRGVSLGFFVDLGSRDEQLADHGCGHVLEHILFKGTSTRTAAQLSSAIESLGGDLNAWTAKDHLCFHAQVLAEHLSVAVDVLADLLINPLITAQDLQAEKEVILDEISMHEDDPTDVAADLAQQVLLDPDPLGRSVIGTIESIQALDIERVRTFHRTHLGAGTIVVSAVGAVDHDQLAAQLSALDWPQADPRPERGIVTPGPGRLVHQFSRLGQTTASLVWPGHGLEEQRRHALAVLLVMLGGGMSSLLFQRVREDHGLAYAIDASDASWQGAGLATIDWQSAPGRTAAILQQVGQLIHELSAGPIPTELVAAARGQLAGQIALQHDQASAQMSQLGLAWLQDTGLTGDDLELAIRAVTDDQVAAELAALAQRRPALVLTGARTPLAPLRQLLSDWPHPV